MKKEITRGLAQQQYNNARTNLLVMVGFTLVNVILALTGSDVMMLFSATFPYIAALFGAAWADGVIIAIVVYFLCWLFSKKRVGWMAAALVLFCIDTVFMVAFYFYIEDFSGFLDVAFHIYVLYYLIMGVRYGTALKKLPEEVEIPMNEGYVPAEAAPVVAPEARDYHTINGERVPKDSEQ